MRHLISTRFPITVFAVVIGLGAMANVSKSDSFDPQTVSASEMEKARTGKFKICPESSKAPDTYALCFTAECWTLDDVAYCKCDLKNGKSISLPFRYREDGKKKDVCDIFLEGVDNGFTVSTYSPPRQMQKDYKPVVEKLGPPMALYTCPGGSGKDTDYSAQCDGGLCFNSSSGTNFPGLGAIGKDEIVCSCPPIPNVPIGFQIAGPWSCDPGDPNLFGNCCDQSFKDKYCNVDHIRKTGTEMVVSAPRGFAAVLAKKLTGSRPKFNQCR